MNIYVYSDESGVFDRYHNDKFVFAGLIFLDKTSKDKMSRKYSKAEKDIRKNSRYTPEDELKASIISNKEKSKLYRSLNRCYKFAVVVDQKRVNIQIFNSKKDKQRYLDYVYKIAVKRALQNMIQRNLIVKNDVERMFFYVDEHTTATNGRYELKEGLEQEFRYGTYNTNYIDSSIIRNINVSNYFNIKLGSKKYLSSSKNKKIIRKTDKWIVHGHVRHYKSGKVVFVEAYYKGPNRKSALNPKTTFRFSDVNKSE